MIDHVPLNISILFIGTCLATLLLFIKAHHNFKKPLIAILLWTLAHSILAIFGFYTIVGKPIPRFALLLLPVFILFLSCALPKHKQWIKQHRNLKLSPFVHVIRIPMEIVLWQLFLLGTIPEMMTFEGCNYDIIIGVSAVIIGYLNFKQKLSNTTLLIWNCIGLCAILFVFMMGIFSSPLPFQQFAFDQPNIAMQYFPYVLLPAVVVPIVIYTHITDIILLKEKVKN